MYFLANNIFYCSFHIIWSAISQNLIVNFLHSLCYTLDAHYPKIYYGVDQKYLNFNKVYMETHRRSGLLISKIALEKLFRYVINCTEVTRQNLVSRNHDFLVTSIFPTSLPLLTLNLCYSD